MSRDLLETFAESDFDLNGNATIGGLIEPNDRSQIEDEARRAIEHLLDALVIDFRNDPNMRDTPRRVAKMLVNETFAGRFETMPAVTDFPNARALDEIYTVGPIDIRSTCSHHLCPIIGKAWIGVIPSERVIGLSKFSRITRWIMSRPQIQEEATVQLADAIEQAIKPRALAVIVRATHTCMTWRGVLETDATMTTSVMRGLFRENGDARAELMRLMEGQQFSCR